MLRAMLTLRADKTLLTAIVASTLVAGCAYGELRHVLRAQIATETSCPEIEVQRKGVQYANAEKNEYKVSGCGILRTYTCPPDDGLVEYGKSHCTYVEGDTDAPELAEEVAEGIEDPFADEAPAATPPAEEPAEAEPDDDAAPAPAGTDAKEAPATQEPPAQKKPAEAKSDAKPADAKPDDAK